MVLSAGTWREMSCAVFLERLARLDLVCLPGGCIQSIAAWNRLPLTFCLDLNIQLAFRLVVTRGYVQPKYLDIFSWSYNLWVLPLAVFHRSNDNVDVDDELEATKCRQRPCGRYTRAATAPQEPHTVCRTRSRTLFSFLTHTALWRPHSLPSLIRLTRRVQHCK